MEFVRICSPDEPEYGEAMNYIERVYGDIQRVSSVLKTSIPAVNALLRVKTAEAQKRGCSSAHRNGERKL